jgi:dipeptidyl aminopeptidase/acylaminoacyl peptidase
LPDLRDLLSLPWALPADVSEDGQTVLVQSNRSGTMQLYRLRTDGGELERLTDLPEPVQGRFVAGSGRILLEMDEGGNERHQLYLLDAEPGAGPEPLVVEPEYLHVAPSVSADGAQLAYSCNRRNGVDLDVYVRSLATGAERCVFAPGGFCVVAGFSPDGRWLGVQRLTERTGDNDLHLIDLEGDESFLVAPEEEDAVFGAPAWTAEGDRFFFATSSGRDHAAIARFDLATRAWRYVLEADWDLDCRIDRAGRRLVVDANEEGASRVSLYDPRTLALERELELPRHAVVQHFAASADGRVLALGLSTPGMPWIVWLADAESGETRRLTPPDGTVREDELAQPSLGRIESFDGESVPYWVFEPAVEPPWPVLLDIHGGPESQRRPIWIPLAQYFVAQGFAVVMPNVRGSTGYGKRFEHLDDGRRRLDAVQDVVALHDRLAADSRYRTDRTVLYGVSYGGYVVLACLAFHPERWAAAIDVVGVSSLVTFLENTSEWRRAFREREYGSLEHDRDFLHEISPITHVDRIRAPLFIVHGANDPRVPLGEAEQVHRALRERGIRTELLVYDDEGHGLNKLANRLDAYPKAVEFLHEVLGG